MANTDAPAPLPAPIDDSAPEPGSREWRGRFALLRSGAEAGGDRRERGLVADAASELREFIERTSLPLYTITMARRRVGRASACHGVCRSGVEPGRAYGVQRADLFLVLGKRIDYGWRSEAHACLPPKPSSSKWIFTRRNWG